jgi:paraquat-inducible protein B
MELVQGNVIENGVNMLLDDLQNQIQDQLNALIDQLLDQVVETLGNVREGLFGNAEEAGLERKALEPILDKLQEILSPLFSAVDHVKGMASMVGIDV